MSSMLTYLTPHTTNIHEVVKSLHRRAEDLDLDIADVMEWVTANRDNNTEIRSVLRIAEEGAFKAVANLEAILTATTLTTDTRGYPHAKTE